MYVGQLLEPSSGLTHQISYFKRGTMIACPPEGDPPAWKWNQLLDTGIDIRISLSRQCYIDRVMLTQGQGSAIKYVKVFTVDPLGQEKCIGRIDAETGGMLEKESLDIAIGAEAQILILRVNACFKDIIVTHLDVIGSVWDRPVLYPLPEKQKNLAPLPFPRAIYLRHDGDQDLAFAAKELAEKCLEDHRVDIPVSLAPKGEIPSGSIVLEKSGGSGEGYSLSTESGSAVLTASSRRGLLYGGEKIRQLLHRDHMEGCAVEDQPRMEFRGVHLGLPPREEIPFFKRMIRYLFAPLGYNTLYLQITAGMRFDRHPEINEAWINANKKAEAGQWPDVPHGDMIAGGRVLEKQEVADLVEYARSYGLEVIPEIQSLSHVQYITMAHPELAELDDSVQDRQLDQREADQPPSTFYHHSYCPSNEASYTLIQDIIDEIVEVVKPERYVHMGHDEVYQIGICPRCKGKDPADLYAAHVTRVHDYLAQKGLKTMIWADMLQSASDYLTPPAIEKIPKDVVLLDFIWYFHPELDIEDNLLPHGFQVILGNMYSSHFTRYDTRAVKPGIVGAQTSSWCRPDEAVLGREGKLYDMMYSANMMWSGQYRSDARFTFTRMVTNLLPRIRDRLRGVPSPSRVPGSASYPITLPEPICRPMSNLEQAVLEDSRMLELSGVLRPQVVLPGSPVVIPVDGPFDSLVFYHAATGNAEKIPWKPCKAIGTYTVRYTDGSLEEIPVEYGGNIYAWDIPYGTPMAHPYYRHTGYCGTYFTDPFVQTKTSLGKNVTICRFEWTNTSGKPISTVTASSAEGTDARILLAALAGIRRG